MASQLTTRSASTDIRASLHRLDRNQFLARMSPFDEEQLRKALWTLYWRGSAAMRERIEREPEPPGSRPPAKAAVGPDPETTLSEVREFVPLARSGAYIAGDRRVSPRLYGRCLVRGADLRPSGELRYGAPDIVIGMGEGRIQMHERVLAAHAVAGRCVAQV